MSDPSFSTLQLSGNHTLYKTYSTIRVYPETFILNCYSSDYKSHLIKLHLLPLMYVLDINDIMFYIKNLHTGFSIDNYVKFVTGSNRLASGHKLIQTRSQLTFLLTTHVPSLLLALVQIVPSYRLLTSPTSTVT